MIQLKHIAGFFLAAGVGVTAASGQTGDGTWQNPGGGLWIQQSNWAGGIPFNAGDVATFGPTFPSGDVTIAHSLPITLGGLIYNNPNRVTLSGGDPFIFDSGTPGTPAFLTVSAASVAGLDISAPVRLTSDLNIDHRGGSLIMRGPLTGSGDLTLSGGGTLLFEQPSTNDNGAYGGNIFVNEGTLFIGGGGRGDTALGNTVGATFVAAGATLDLNGATGNDLNAESLTLSGFGDGGIGAVRYSRGSQSIYVGDITLVGDTAINSDNNANGRFHIGNPNGSPGGSLAGDGRLIKIGGLRPNRPGPLQLNLQATHTGGTEVREGWFIISQHGSLVGTGDVTISPDGTLFIQRAAGGDATLNSVDAQGVVLDGGTLVLEGDVDPINLFDASSSGGRLSFGANNTADLNISTLLGGTDGGSRLTLTSQNESTYSGTIRFDPADPDPTLRVDLPTKGLTLAGPLLAENGVGGLTKSGDQRLIVSGDNDFTGQVQVLGGELRAGHPNALGAATGLEADGTIVDTGATLTLGGNTIGNEFVRLAEGAKVRQGTVGGPVVSNGGILEDVTISGSLRVEGGLETVAINGSDPTPLNVTGPVALVQDSTLRGPITVTGGLISTGGTVAGGANLTGGLNLQAGLTRLDGITATGTLQGPGDLRLGLNTTASLDTAAFTGDTIIAGSQFSLQGAPHPAGGFEVLSGGTLLAAPGTSQFDANITLRGGGFGSQTFATNGGLAVTGDITLAGNYQNDILLPKNTGTKSIQLNGEVSGTGDLSLNGPGQTTLNGPLNFTGDLIVGGTPSPSNAVLINGALSLNGRILVKSGSLEIADAFSVEDAVLTGGSILIDLGATLSTDSGEVLIRGGALRGEVTNGLTLRVQSGALSSIINLSDTSNSQVRVENGSVTFGGGGSVFLDDATTQIRGFQLQPVDADVFLQDALGPGGTGAVDSLTLRGQTDLGGSGSRFTGQNAIQGSLTGGDLDIVGGRTTIDSLQIAHTGVTRLRGGDLVIDGGGQLDTPGGVTVGPGSALEIVKNAPAEYAVNRVGDSVEITLGGGSLIGTGDGFAPSAASLEQLGDVTLAQGLNVVRVNQIDFALADLQRQPRGLLRASGFDGSIHVDATLALNDGILGGWATDGISGSFLTQAPSGELVALGSAGRPSTIAAATASDNVLYAGGSETLAASATINSLELSNQLGTPQMDLGGNTLDIESGGFSATSTAGSVVITNGQLTASGSELFFYGRSNGANSINAGIVDTGATPLDVSVASGSYFLGGDNTYTGTTHIYSQLTLADAGALPLDGDLDVSGGLLDLRPGLYNAGDIIIQNGGDITANSGGVSVNADSVELRDGQLSVPLTGNATLTKTTPGTALIRRNSTNFTGDVLVQEGDLFVQAASGLGTGTTTVGPLGRLRVNTPIESGSILLDGGELTGGFFRVPIQVSADSALTGENFFHFDGPITGTGDLDILTSRFQTVEIAGDSSAYTGDVTLAPDVSVLLLHADALGSGTTTLTGGSSIRTANNAPGQPERITADLRFADGGGTLRTLSFGGSSFGDEALTLTGNVDVVDVARVESIRTDFQGRLTLADSARLHVDRPGGAAIASGTFQVADNTTVQLAPAATFAITGDLVADSTVSSFDVGLPESFSFNGGVEVATGRDLSVTAAGERVQLNIASGRSIRGGGTLHNSITIDAGGTVAPGDTGAPAGGTLSVDGSVTFNPASSLIIDIDPDAADRLAATGPVAVAGALTLGVNDPGAFDLYDSRDIVTASSLTGTFATVAGVVLNSSNGLAVTYAADRVSVTAALLGDTNLDQQVNTGDLAVLGNNFGMGGAVWTEGDFNGDGVVNTGDLAVLAANFGATPGGPAATPLDFLAAGRSLGISDAILFAAIPEPTTLTLLGLGVLGLIARPRRGPSLRKPGLPASALPTAFNSTPEPSDSEREP